MSQETRSVTWSIGKAAQTVTLSPTSVSVQAGQSETITVSFLGDGIVSATSSDTGIATVSVSGNVVTVTGVDDGTATIEVTVSEGTNYFSGSATANAVVSDVSVVLPTQSGTLTYNKAVQEPVWNNYNPNQLTIGGTTDGTNAGTYTATFTPKTGYAWSDTGTTEARDATWVIDTMKVTLPSQSGSLTYDGTSQSPTWTPYDPDAFTVGGTTSGTNAGDYNATFTPNPNYEWAS